MTDQPRHPQERGGMRPAGKRQVSGVSTTSSEAYAAKKAVAVKDHDEEKKSRVKAAVDYVPETVEEMKKVIWPTARQMVIYTLIVFAFLIVLTALVWGVDTLSGLGVEKVLGVKPKLS